MSGKIQQDKVKKIINEHIDDLEDVLNMEIRKILEQQYKEVDIDDIVYARDVFFEGNLV